MNNQPAPLPLDEDCARRARLLMRRCLSGALASLERKSKAPYVSLVTYAPTLTGEPIFLLSKLAEHTRNILEDPRVSLLVEASSHLSNPQTGPRVSLSGILTPCDAPETRERFLKLMPKASLYAGFGDFGLYRMQVEKCQFVEGFGRAYKLKGADFLSESLVCEGLQENQQQLISKIIETYGEKIRFQMPNSAASSIKTVTPIAVDPDGIDVMNRKKRHRVDFDFPLKNADLAFSQVSKLFDMQ